MCLKKFPYIEMLLKYLGQKYNVNKKSMKNPIKPNDNVSGQAVINSSQFKKNLIRSTENNNSFSFCHWHGQYQNNMKTI